MLAKKHGTPAEFAKAVYGCVNVEAEKALKALIDEVTGACQEQVVGIQGRN